MPKSQVRYISLTPTKDSRLDYDDTKQLLSSVETPIELVIKSQPEKGIELFMGAPASDVDSLIKQIYSISPGLIITKVKTSDAHISKPSVDHRYILNKHYAYPLHIEGANEVKLSQLMRRFAQIKDREEVELHISVIPTNPLKARLLRNKLLAGALPPAANTGLIAKSTSILLSSLSAASEVFRLGSVLINSKTIRPRIKVVNTKSVMLLDKLFDSLFSAQINLLIKAGSRKHAEEVSRNIDKALRDFVKKSGAQELISSSVSRPSILSASDLAGLFHLDSSELNSGLYRVEHFKHLPSQLPTKISQIGDVSLGVNRYQDSSKELVLSLKDRYRHMYICGATGSGKSTLMGNLILQDINANQGLTLIDPHGDLANDVMHRVPKHRQKDVIYFDSKNLQTINLLELKSKPYDKDYQNEADQITEGIISLFHKVFGDDLSGHRIEYILRNSIQTALTIPNSTIFTIYRLLTDASFRIAVIPKLNNPDLINFWRNELGRAGEYQRVKMTAGVTAKLGRFLFSSSAKRVFGQPKSSLDLDKVLNERKILICNFAKGQLGEDGSKLFATSVLTKIQLAANRRSSIDPKERLDHFLYVDEFQTYAPSVLVQILSEARKYGLYLTMAEQSPSQQDIRSTSNILANAGNLVCFRTASSKDTSLLIDNFKDYLTPSDLSNLPAFNYYLKSTATASVPPTSGMTYPLIDLAAFDTKTKYKATERLYLQESAHMT